jgi:L-rhamnose mutarotase
MIRRAFTMRLKPGGLAGYRERHDNIWSELVAEIGRSGIAQITIFENDPVLVLYSEIADEGAWDRLWATEVHERWGAIMNEYMAVDETGAPEASELREVFHLETPSSTNETAR